MHQVEAARAGGDRARRRPDGWRRGEAAVAASRAGSGVVVALRPCTRRCVLTDAGWSATAAGLGRRLRRRLTRCRVEPQEDRSCRWSGRSSRRQKPAWPPSSTQNCASPPRVVVFMSQNFLSETDSVTQSEIPGRAARARPTTSPTMQSVGPSRLSAHRPAARWWPGVPTTAPLAIGRAVLDQRDRRRRRQAVLRSIGWRSTGKVSAPM